MTEKEYEGTPELIFYCEYNPNDFEDRLEIPFTNEYDIKLDFSRDEDNQVCIYVDLQPKESNIPKDFFGKNILNVTAIAGKNGVGKTTIIRDILNRCRIQLFKVNSQFCIDAESNGMRSQIQINNNNYTIHTADLNVDKVFIDIEKGIFVDRSIKYPIQVSSSSRWSFINSHVSFKNFVILPFLGSLKSRGLGCY